MYKIFKLLLTVICVTIFLACNSKVKINNSNSYARAKFIDTVFDFKTINAGEKISFSFMFKNIGNSDLQILDAQTGCSCTNADFSKTPVAAGAESKINVTFDSFGKVGNQYESIRVKTNGQPAEYVLQIYGLVTPPELISNQ